MKTVYISYFNINLSMKLVKKSILKKVESLVSVFIVRQKVRKYKIFYQIYIYTDNTDIIDFLYFITTQRYM